MHIARPEDSEVFTFFQEYVSEAVGDDLLAAFGHATTRLQTYAAGVSPTREEHRYAVGKWTVKEVYQHLNDTERILAYRALRFARSDKTELHGFEENDYVTNANTERRKLADLMEEHLIIRQSTIALFRSLTPEMLLHTGVANGKRISVRGLGWSIAGHAMHHVEILDHHYL